MAQAASKTCQLCMSAAGSQYCLDCEEYYCENCKLLHNRQKLSRTHQFKKASDLIPEATCKCNEHTEELTLICNTCGLLVCTSCVTGKHNGHSFSKLSEAIAQLRRKNETRLKSRRKEANERKKNIEQSLVWFDNAVESVTKTLTDESTMNKRMVDTFVAKMIALVEKQSEKEKMISPPSSAPTFWATLSNDARTGVLIPPAVNPNDTTGYNYRQNGNINQTIRIKKINASDVLPAPQKCSSLTVQVQPPTTDA